LSQAYSSNDRRYIRKHAQDIHGTCEIRQSTIQVIYNFHYACVSCETCFCEDSGFLSDTNYGSHIDAPIWERPPRHINRVQFRDEVHQKYYDFDAHERRTEEEKVLMTEYYATECKNRCQITDRPPVISPIQCNLLRIDIYNPLGLISLSATIATRESLVMRNLLVREPTMIPEIACLTRDQQIDLPSAPLYDICESIKTSGRRIYI